MSIFDSQSFVIPEFPKAQNAPTFNQVSHFAEISIGSGEGTVIYGDKEGIKFGSRVFDDANAYIKTDGSFKFKNSAGTVIIDSLGAGGNFINVINAALNTSSKTILQDFSFTATDYAGAFKTGTIAWSPTTGLVTSGSGVVMNARGILGAANGVATFTLDATTGNATFSGTLVAAAGTLGSITAGTISGVTISGSTVYGGNIYASSSASTGNVHLYVGAYGGQCDIEYGGVQKGFFAANATTTILGSNVDLYLESEDYLRLIFNSDGGSDICEVVNDANGHTQFQDDGDLYILAGDAYFDDYFTYDYAEYFEAIPEFGDKKIPIGTSMVFDNGLTRPALVGEIPFGIVSDGSFVHGGGAGAKEWKGKYQRDELGRLLKGDRERWYAKWKDGKKIRGWSDEVAPPKGAKLKIKQENIISPDYDSKKDYLPRKDRPEWNDIGLIGQIPLLKGQPTNPNWTKIKDISDNYELWLVK